jgi:hypothetical protein
VLVYRLQHCSKQSDTAAAAATTVVIIIIYVDVRSLIFMISDWFSSLAYPDLFGIKGSVVGVVFCISANSTYMLHGHSILVTYPD